MFIATMFSFGNDADAVGVDGIRGCLGVFLETPTRLYAVHVPENPQHYDAARQAFVGHVLHTDPNFARGASRLYAVINGTNRSQAYGELLGYSTALGVRRLMTARVNEYLGPKGQMQESAAIVLERIPNTTKTRLKYARASNVQWRRGVGTARSGYYANASFDYVLSVEPTLAYGWHLVDDGNSTIATTNW